MSQQINLVNPKFLSQKQYFSLINMSHALLLILAGSALFYAYADYQVRQISVQLETSKIRYTESQAKLAQVSKDYSPQQARKILEDELKKTETQLAGQRELIARLKSGELGNTNGYSEYMRAFGRQANYGLWLTGFDIVGDGVQINLSGGALNPELVPVFIKGLNHEKIMRGKEFAGLSMQQHKAEAGKPAGRSYLEFSLQSSEADRSKK